MNTGKECGGRILNVNIVIKRNFNMSENKYPIGGYAANWNPNDKERDALVYAGNVVSFMGSIINKLSSGCSYEIIENEFKSAKYHFDKLFEIILPGQPKPAGTSQRDETPIPAVDHDQAHINMDAGMPDFEAYYQAGFSNGHDVGYSKAQREFEKAPQPAGAVWPLIVVDKITGERHEVNKIVYHPENEPEPHIWCDTWYGHHIIGKDCEWIKVQAAGATWVKAALQWSKEAIEFANKEFECPQHYVETWGNMYMNVLHAIDRALDETPTPNNDHITAALRKFISMHETGLLPNRFTYEEGKKALEGVGENNDAIEFAEWLRVNNMSPNGFGGWGGGKINTNIHGSKTDQLHQIWQQSKSK